MLTQQEGGCIVHFQDSSRLIPAPIVEEVNPTGAGDIFATAFLVRLHQTRGNPWEAAEFANLVASSTVAKNTLSGKINSIRDVIIQES